MQVGYFDMDDMLEAYGYTRDEKAEFDRKYDVYFNFDQYSRPYYIPQEKDRESDKAITPYARTREVYKPPVVVKLPHTGRQ